MQPHQNPDHRNPKGSSTSAAWLRGCVGWALASLCASVLLIGCGRGSGAGVANLGSSRTTSTTSHTSSGGSSQSEALKYAACMRSHGEPSYPDPSSSGAIGIQASSGVDPGSPQYKAAADACKPLLPSAGVTPAQQQQNYASALKYAACMRAHGEPNFPDPPAPDSGNGPVSQSNKGGSSAASNAVNPSSPQFIAANKACQNLLGASSSQPSLSSAGQQ